METENLVSAGLGVLILYLLLRSKSKVEAFPPSTLEESVTSTITYGNPMPAEMVN